MAETVAEIFDDERYKSASLQPGATSVKNLLEGHSTVPQTLQNLTANEVQTDAATQSEVLEYCIIEVAEQLPETHSKLVELIVALREREQTRGADQLTAFDGKLGFSLNERWLRYGVPDFSDSGHDDAISDWTNLNRFVAMLYAAGLQQLLSFGEDTLDMSLRRSGWRSNSKTAANTTDDPVALQGHAPAAAHWIVVSGQRLYNDSEKVRANWSKWTADLGWIAVQDSVYGETKSLCDQALTIMQSVHT